MRRPIRRDARRRICDHARMPTIHLLCGLPGSGKSTLAAQLEREHGALRLSPDEWIQRLQGGDGRDEAFRGRVLALQFDLAMRTLALGADVVWDHGCWSRAERDACRIAAEKTGAGYRLYWLDIPADELKRRLAARNADLPAGSFVVTAEDIDAWSPVFERPGMDEPGLVRGGAGRPAARF
jgi:predicted kinase